MPQTKDLLFGLLVLGSLIFWCRLLLKIRTGRPPLPLHDRPAVSLDLFSVLAVLLVWAMVPLLVGELFGLTDKPSAHIARMSSLGGGLSVLVTAGILLAGGYRPAELGIGLKHWRSDLRDGALGYLASFLPVALVLLATYRFRSKETQHELLQLVENDPRLETILWIVVAVVFVAPLVEELVFRVVLQGALESRIGPRPAIVLVALLFSMVHPWPDCLPLIPLALVLGYVYHRRHSFLAVVVLHAIFNAMNLILALLTIENGTGGR